MRRLIFFSAWLCFMAMGTKAFSSDMVVVEADLLNMRSAPDRNASVVAVLTRGERLRLIREMDGWVRVAHGRREGYLRDRPIYIRKISSRRDDMEMEKIRKEREKVRVRIEEEQRALNRYKIREVDVIAELNAIDRILNEVNINLSSIRKEQADLLKKRRKTRESMAILEKERYRRRQLVGQRLTAFYKLENAGRVNLLAAADNIYEFSVQKRAIEGILHLDEQILEDHGQGLRDLALLSERLEREEDRIGDAAQRAEEQARIQRLEKNRRNALLDEIRSKQKLGLATVSALKNAQKKLDNTIAALGRQKVKPSPSRTAGAFAKHRGLLDLPVNGKIISRFGHQQNPKQNIHTFQSGISIRADRGEPIRALFSGTVIYADWFSGYGNMIIIDHGDHYYSVYAHAEELFKKTGDGVVRNEVIATVGDSGSLSGSMLHFEIRQQGKPLDPMLWVKRG